MQGESARRTIEGAGTDAPLTTDLIRSMAVSSAELWHDVLQRLAELQESQLILAQAVADLGTVVRDSLPLATPHALPAASPLALEAVATSLDLPDVEHELRGPKARKAKRAAKAATVAEAKAAKAAAAAEAKAAKTASIVEKKTAKADAKPSGHSFLHRRRHVDAPVEQAPLEDVAVRREPAVLPPPPVVTPPPPPMNVVSPVSAVSPMSAAPSSLDEPVFEMSSVPTVHAGSVFETRPAFESAPEPESAPAAESSPSFDAPAAAPLAPKALVYTPATAETTNGATQATTPAPAFSIPEPFAVAEPAPEPFAVAQPAPEPFEPVLAGVGARSFSDSASIASEIFSNAPSDASVSPSAPAVLVISEDVTLISKNRKRRLQFRLK